MKFMKFDQFMPGEIFFLKNHAENHPERLVPDLFLLIKGASLYKVKASGQHLSFNIFW